jgi:RNA polymerase sigma factor (sigma-70 family)
MRRIHNVEKELAMQTPGLQPPSPSALAEACGYVIGSVAEMNDAVQRGHRAREALVTTNMGLVHHVVQSIVGGKGGSRRGGAQTLARDDLIQEGAIGLARAVDRWNPDIGGKFSTYAYYWIRAGVLRGIAQRDEIVRVPEHMRTVINKLERAATALGIDNVFADKRWKEARAAKALAEEAGLTPKQVEQAWQVQDRRRNMVSFEAWMEQGRDVSSMSADSSATSSAANSAPMASVELHDLKSTLGKFLRPRELEALSWRYGLMNDRDEPVVAQPTKEKKTSPRSYVAEAELELFGSVDNGALPDALPSQGRWGEAMSFVEVGKRMKVSAEYGRRLCHAAIEKLQRAAQEGALLEPALLF